MLMKPEEERGGKKADETSASLEKQRKEKGKININVPT